MNDHDLLLMLHERMRSAAAALILQHTEYERRLEMLNHEAARITAERANFMPRELHANDIADLRGQLAKQSEFLSLALPREVWEQARKESREREELTKREGDQRRDRRDARITALEKFKSTMTGAGIPLTLIAGAVGAAVMKVIVG